jgi:hypothetical protein
VLLLPQQVLTKFKAVLVATCASAAPLVGVCNPGKTLFEDWCYAMTSTQVGRFPDLVLKLGHAGVDQISVPVTSACAHAARATDLPL